MSQDLKERALRYHRYPRPGKLAILPTKPMATKGDLALAYSPGVAEACNEIAREPTEAANLTARGNLVAVVSNGTAVLGLGAIGALASKPVMEGKAVLFKKFADVDVFDIEIEERDPEKLVEIIAGLEATFGGINLEDIKAPECFYVERTLRERMKIPVFHDDQHGTAIVTAAAVLNGLRVVEKKMAEVKLVCSGAGAAAIACLDLLVSIGMTRENILVCDSRGVVHSGRTGLDQSKARYSVDTDARTLADAMHGADVFLGLSTAGVLKQEMAATMADRPLILALSNPTPEIMPEVAMAVKPDAVMATGRSDYPNQVNNVLCFPFIFRGALDVGATVINEEMKVACVKAIADMAQAVPSDVVQAAYAGEALSFGPEYILPKPFDPRLISTIAPAVAQAAMDSGVAARPIEDMEAYRRRLTGTVYRSGLLMEPIMDRARRDPKRLVYAEGEERRVLQAAQLVVDERMASPILVGRPEVVEQRIRDLGLSMRAGTDFELINPLGDVRYREYWSEYHRVMGRKGATPAESQTVVRTQNTAIAALMVRKGEADAMICGTVGRFRRHVQYVRDIVGLGSGIRDLSTLSAVVLPRGTYFICDSHISAEPSAEEMAEMTVLAAREVARFGLTPKVALVSRSSFGSHELASGHRMRRALEILRERQPDLEVEGEMHADAAVAEDIRAHAFPDSVLKGQANLLIMPNVDAAHIAYGLLKVLGGGVTVGPILVGAARPAHVLTQSTTVRGLYNMSAVAVAQVQVQAVAR